MKIIKRNNLQFHVREGTLDEWVVDEVSGDASYINPLEIKDTDIVLDIGANIGVFTVTALQRGAVVVAYEPDYDNFSIAKKNIKLNGLQDCATIHNLGVSDVDKTTWLYLPDNLDKSHHR